MPRIFGVNIIAWLVSAVALYFVGFVFYGLLFSEAWVSLWNFSPEQIEAAEAAAGPSMALGFVISLATAFFIGLALKKFGAEGLVPVTRKAVFLWAGFVVTTLAYDTVYALQPVMLLVIDSAHLLVGFIVVAVLHDLLDGVMSKD